MEIWHNSRQEQIVVGKNFLIIRSHYQVNIHYLLSISNEEMYGIIRSEITRLIRIENQKKSCFSFHAGLVEYEKKKIMIVGDKGMGKTSSCLYFLEKGAKNFTDELVFFNADVVSGLSRLMSISVENMQQYFSDYRNEVFRKSKSVLNLQEKVILKTKYSNNKLNNIDEVILLVHSDSNLNTQFPYIKRKQLLSTQLIPGNVTCTENEIAIFNDLIEKTSISSVSEIKSKLGL